LSNFDNFDFVEHTKALSFQVV